MDWPANNQRAILRGLEHDWEEQRRPHVLRLGELHQRLMSGTIFQDCLTVH